MTFDGETEKRYRQISLIAGDTIYFNFLIDGNPIDETFLAYTPDEDGTYTVTFDPRSPRTISIRRIEDSVEEVVDEIIRANIIAAYETLSTSTDASAVAQAIAQAYVQGYNSRVDYGTNG